MPHGRAPASRARPNAGRFAGRRGRTSAAATELAAAQHAADDPGALDGARAPGGPSTTEATAASSVTALDVVGDDELARALARTLARAHVDVEEERVVVDRRTRTSAVTRPWMVSSSARPARPARASRRRWSACPAGSRRGRPDCAHHRAESQVDERGPVAQRAILAPASRRSARAAARRDRRRARAPSRATMSVQSGLDASAPHAVRSRP
jgi:hypothetical protein